MKIVDLTGQTVGRLSVIGYSHSENGARYWKCKCACGNYKNVSTVHLNRKIILSCGCLHRENASRRMKNYNDKHTTKHRLSTTRVYNIWVNILRRCKDSKSNRYSNYGGRGIKVCDEWLEFTNFYKWATNSGYRDDLTIDRIDTYGDYEPNNCKWSTKIEQMNNTTKNKFETFDGQTKTHAQWARMFGINSKQIYKLFKIGLTITDIASKYNYAKEFAEV